MARLRYNGLSTTLGGSLTNVATSVTFAAALTHSNGTNVPTIVAPDYIPLAILGATGHLSEIVYLTAYTAAGTTGTITRGVEGTAGAAHSSGDVVTGAALVADSSIFSGFYGDGSDGNVTITTTVSLTRDMFYDTLTINSPGILKASGYKIHCKTAVAIGSGGALQSDGSAGAGSVGGAAPAQAAVGAGGASGNGTTTTGGNASAVSNQFGGNGGAGGAGTSAAGTVPAATPPGASAGSMRAMPNAAIGALTGAAAVTRFNGGQGGSAGGGDGTGFGGGGGGGGGVLIVNARAVTNSGTISANGGNGGNGGGTNCGGGGGGGGGVLIVNTAAAITGSAPTATGGTGGSKTGTGVAGSAGSAGLALVNVWI